MYEYLLQIVKTLGTDRIVTTVSIRHASFSNSAYYILDTFTFQIVHMAHLTCPFF